MNKPYHLLLAGFFYLFLSPSSFARYCCWTGPLYGQGALIACPIGEESGPLSAPCPMTGGTTTGGTTTGGTTTGGTTTGGTTTGGTTTGGTTTGGSTTGGTTTGGTTTGGGSSTTCNGGCTVTEDGYGCYVNGGGATCTISSDGICRTVTNNDLTPAFAPGKPGTGNLLTFVTNLPRTMTGKEGGGGCGVIPGSSCSAVASQSWTVSGSTCSASLTSTADGNTQAISDSSSPATGSASYKCVQGAWQLLSTPASTCTTTCTGTETADCVCTYKPCSTCAITDTQIDGLTYKQCSTYTAPGGSNWNCKWTGPAACKTSCVPKDVVVGCFVQGSKVRLTSGAEKAIEELVVGDRVMSYNSETGQPQSDTVKEIFHHPAKLEKIYRFDLSNGRTVISNDVHLFYLPNEQEYRSAETISDMHDRGASPMLLGPDNDHVYIRMISMMSKVEKLYNIHVAKNHNYYVEGILVHNEKSEEQMDAAETMCTNCVATAGVDPQTSCDSSTGFPRRVILTGCQADIDKVQACMSGGGDLNWPLETLCFAEGTPVSMADGSVQAIEDVQEGEKVFSYDEVEKKVVVAPVVKTFHHSVRNNELYQFTFEDGRTLTSNGIHPIYIVELNTYLEAKKIYEKWLGGESLSVLSQQGKQAIRLINTWSEKSKLYNLHVRSARDTKGKESEVGHNYFANGVLVHNKSVLPTGTPQAQRCCTDSGAVDMGDASCTGTQAQKDAYFSCMAGTCPVQSVTWRNVCVGELASTSVNTDYTVGYNTGTYYGSAIYTCNSDKTWSLKSAASCAWRQTYSPPCGCSSPGQRGSIYTITWSSPMDCSLTKDLGVIGTKSGNKITFNFPPGNLNNLSVTVECTGMTTTQTAPSVTVVDNGMCSGTAECY